MYIFIILGVLGSCVFYALAFYILRKIKNQTGFDSETDYKRLFWLSMLVTIGCAYVFILPPFPLYEDEHTAFFWTAIFNGIIMGGLARQEV